MSVVATVARNTLKEIIRDKILYGLVVFAFLLVLVSLLLGDLSFAQQEKIITDLGLVAVEFGCCMLAIFVGGSLVHKEIEKQTILLLISKPVKRSSFLMGKFLGLSAVIVLADVVISCFLALMCHAFGVVYWEQFIVAQSGVILESLLLLSFAIFFGTFARPTTSSIFTFFIWLIGHGINDLRYFSEKSKIPFIKIFGSVVSRVFPNLDSLGFREAAVYGDPITTHVIATGAGIWLAWSVILIILTMWIFERRDFI